MRFKLCVWFWFFYLFYLFIFTRFSRSTAQRYWGKNLFLSQSNNNLLMLSHSNHSPINCSIPSSASPRVWGSHSRTAPGAASPPRPPGSCSPRSAAGWPGERCPAWGHAAEAETGHCLYQTWELPHHRRRTAVAVGHESRSEMSVGNVLFKSVRVTSLTSQPRFHGSAKCWH